MNPKIGVGGGGGWGGGAGSLTSVVGPRRTSSATCSPYPTAPAVASLDGADSIRNARGEYLNLRLNIREIVF